jgi:pantoate--beta-alanine ligase
MITLDGIDALRNQVRAWRNAGERIGFVPTMGSLHEGHMSLLEAARQHATKVISSVFVNPLQFGPGEDFERYPRTPDQDQLLLSKVHCDLLFQPSVEEMYPGGRELATRVMVPALSDILCGAFRPGHFEGVATVVAKLFGIVQPDIAVFGEKDFQQLTVIRRMATDLNLPVQVLGAPTVRAEDGLAMSSRNRYLSEAERAIAPRLFATLRTVVDRIKQGEHDYAGLEAWGTAQLQSAGLRPDYFTVRDAASLLPPDQRSTDLVVLTAARLGRARLIDNLRVPR